MSSIHVSNVNMISDARKKHEIIFASDLSVEVPTFTLTAEAEQWDYPCVDPTEMSHSVMKGMTRGGRCFFLFRVIGRENKVTVTTVFQRYCGNPNNWALSGAALIEHVGGIPENQFYRLEGIVNGGRLNGWILA